MTKKPFVFGSNNLNLEWFYADCKSESDFIKAINGVDTQRLKDLYKELDAARPAKATDKDPTKKD